MMIFTFAFMLLFCIGSCVSYGKKDVVLPVFLGAFAALCVCAFKTFFLYAHRIVPYSFGENFSFLLVRQAVLPVILLYAIFLLLSRDTWDYKAGMFLPLETAFYAVYLPFCIVSSAEGLYSAFALFVKPFIFAAMLFQISFSLRMMINAASPKKTLRLVTNIILILIFLLSPAIIETYYILNTRFLPAVLCAAVYCAVPLAEWVLNFIISQKNA